MLNGKITISVALSRYPNIVRMLGLIDSINDRLGSYNHSMDKRGTLKIVGDLMDDLDRVYDEEVKRIEKETPGLDIDDPNIDWGSRTEDSMEGFIDEDRE